MEWRKESKLNGVQKHQTYEQDDWWTASFVNPHPDKVPWSKVYRRVTVDRDTREMFEDVQIEPNTKAKDYEYKITDQVCMNILTTFYFRESGPEKKPDIVEIYSPPRITEEAKKAGLKDGFALDLTLHRSDGRAWDFSIKKMRDEATRMVVERKPFMLISSQPCTM